MLPKLKNTVLAAVFMIVSSSVYADTRPDSPKKRTFEETKRLLNLGRYVRCSLSQNFILQTKEGLNTPDNDNYSKTVLFDSLAPKASSPSDFATYALFWKNADFDFYFFMNSEIGEIRVFDKKKGFSAENSLDLSDFGKEEVYIGQARLIQREDILVTSPRDASLKVPGERITYLQASCQFLEGYVP